MKYRVGQKVVYIGPDFSRHPLIALNKLKVPVPRSVYTIRGGSVMPCGNPGYVFDEIVNPEGLVRDYLVVMELHMDEVFLRPLIERKTDISAFHEILRDAERQVYRPFRDKVKA